MSDYGKGLPHLPPEWREAAETAVRNLGLPADLMRAPPENWRQVLYSVEIRMGLQGVTPPDGWREALAVQVGRTDPAIHAGAES